MKYLSLASDFLKEYYPKLHQMIKAIRKFKLHLFYTSIDRKFTKIYSGNIWSSSESFSGT